MQGPGYIWAGVGGHRRWNLLHFLGNLQVSTENPSYGGRVIGDFLCLLPVLNYCKHFVLINFNFRTVLNPQNYFKLIQKFPYTQHLVLPLFFFFLAMLHSWQDLSSLTRDQTHGPYSGSAES